MMNIYGITVIILGISIVAILTVFIIGKDF
jgi:hypothetical protein